MSLLCVAYASCSKLLSQVFRLETRHPSLETNLDRRHLQDLLRKSRFDWKQTKDISSHSQNAGDFSQLFMELLTIEEITNKATQDIIDEVFICFNLSNQKRRDNYMPPPLLSDNTCLDCMVDFTNAALTYIE